LFSRYLPNAVKEVVQHRAKVFCGRYSQDGSVFMSASQGMLSPFYTWRFFPRERAQSECDWVVMTSVFVVSQSNGFLLCSREQIHLVENRRIQNTTSTKYNVLSAEQTQVFMLKY
jgi:hypothetical protein